VDVAIVNELKTVVVRGLRTVVIAVAMIICGMDNVESIE
jgi:hypothetical protein